VAVESFKVEKAVTEVSVSVFDTAQAVIQTGLTTSSSSSSNRVRCFCSLFWSFFLVLHLCGIHEKSHLFSVVMKFPSGE